MSVLDQTDRWTAIDPNAMRTYIEEFPEYVRTAGFSGCNVHVRNIEKIQSIVVSGLGGSAIGGDLARTIAGRQLSKPLVVNRDYALPPFVDQTTLVFVCSYSGNTEETLSAYHQAIQAGASIICIASGGELAARAESDGHQLLLLPPGFPPRAALGFSLFTLLGALQKLQCIQDLSDSIEETVTLLKSISQRCGLQNPESQNDAKKIARSLHGRVIAIYGSGSILDAVAFRWRSQIEENAKNLAFHHVLPEMNHNELVGWRYPEAVLCNIGVVLLRDKEDHPQVQRRFELTKEIISGKAAAVHEVWSEGKSLLARVMSLIYMGDYVSLFLAYLNNIDPTPVDVIDYFKSKLSVKESE